MKTLYLHIGTHKTATTAIQHFCCVNHQLLAESGVAYPLFPEFKYVMKSGERNGLFLSTVYQDRQGVRHEDIEKERFEQGLEKVHQYFESCDTVVLSDEALWISLFLDPKIMQTLASDSEKYGYTIRLIIYLRRQDKFIESKWNQSVKRNRFMRLDFPAYVKWYPYLDYYKILSSFAESLPAEDIIVRRFSDAVKGDGIIADFLEQIGLPLTEEFNVAEAPSNPRLEGNLPQIKRTMNTLTWINNKENLLLRAALTTCNEAARKDYSCSEFSEEERVAFMEQFREGNAAIAEQFIRDGKPLFSEDYASLPKRDPNNPALIDDVIRAGTAVDLTLYRRCLAAEKRIKELEDRLETIEKQLAKNTSRIEHLRHPLKALQDRGRK